MIQFLHKNAHRLLRRLSPDVANHFTLLIQEARVALVHHKGRRKASRHQEDRDIKLNIGSGSHIKAGFLNLDFSESADIRLDLRRSLPFKDNSCSLIFTEHFVEHIPYPEGVENFLSDCIRMLETGGVISISVPDTEWPLQQFCSGEEDWVKACAKHHWHPDGCDTYMEHLNYHFRQRWRGRHDSHFECHRFAYDYETIKKKLAEAGFSQIERRTFDPELDSPHRKVGSLFVQAVKP